MAALFAAAVLLSPSMASAAVSTICTVTDERLPAITGIVALPDRFVAVSGDVNGVEGSLRAFALTPTCQASPYLNDFNIDPNSLQDLARTPDGTLWAADIGDDSVSRETVAVHRIKAGAEVATRFRLKYPDGPHQAAALVMAANGVPVIITKEANNVAKVYTTAAPLTSAQANIPLVAAGTVTIPASGTAGSPFGKVGQTAVTGAALSPNGKKVVIRTYTDAYEWDIAGTIPATITKGKARHTPMPNESRGEAISYTADGTAFVTASATSPSKLMRWTPAVAAKPSAAAAPTENPASADDGFSLTDVSLTQLTGAIVVIGILGLLMLAVGIVRIVRFRRQGPSDADDAPHRPRSDPPDRDRRRSVDEDPWETQPPAGVGQPQDETLLLPRVSGAVYGRRPEPDRETVPPQGRTNGRVYGAPAPGLDDLDATHVSNVPAVRPAGSVYGTPGTVYGGARHEPAPPPAFRPPSPAEVPSVSPAQSRATVYGSTASNRASSNGAPDTGNTGRSASSSYDGVSGYSTSARHDTSSGRHGSDGRAPDGDAERGRYRAEGDRYRDPAADELDETQQWSPPPQHPPRLPRRH